MEIKMKTACSFSEGTNPVRESVPRQLCVCVCVSVPSLKGIKRQHRANPAQHFKTLLLSEGTNPVRERQASVHTYVEEAEPRQAKPWLFVNEQII